MHSAEGADQIAQSTCVPRVNPEGLAAASTNTDRRPWTQAGAGSVGGLFRVNAMRITTPRAGARRTCQTAYLIWRTAFGWVQVAHPCLLLYLMRSDRIAMPWWMARHWLPHSWWAWSSVTPGRAISIRRGCARGWARSGAQGVARRGAATSVHGITIVWWWEAVGRSSVLQLVQALGGERVRARLISHVHSVNSTKSI